VLVNYGDKQISSRPPPRETQTSQNVRVATIYTTCCNSNTRILPTAYVQHKLLTANSNTVSLYKSGTAFYVRCDLQVPLSRPRCIRRSVSCLSPRISGFDPESVHVRYVMDEVAPPNTCYSPAPALQTRYTLLLT
jgi:hypothetical protein